MLIITIIHARSLSHRLAYKFKPQLVQFHFSLIATSDLNATAKFDNELSSSSLNLLEKYGLFCSLLKEMLTAVISSRSISFKRTYIAQNRISVPWWNDRYANAINSQNFYIIFTRLIQP